jgi:hypothetical protein
MSEQLKQQHTAEPCRQVGGVEQHYSNKNYSDKFVCGVCGKSRRFSLNFLGNRRVPMCDGVNIKSGETLDYHTYRALKERAKAGAA